MARTLRFRKNNKRVYEITYTRGRDPITHKLLTPYRMFWEVPEGYSDKKADKEAAIIEADFIAKCKNGMVLTKQQEKEKALQAALQVEKKIAEYNACPTLTEYATGQYIEERRIEVKRGSIENTINPGLKPLLKVIGDVKMVDITEQMMRKTVVDHFLNSGLLYSSCDNHFAVWKRMFDQAVEDKIITKSPMKDIKKPGKPTSQTDEYENKSLTLEEYEQLTRIIEKEPLRWQAMFYFMIDTGCRRGEVAGMKWENIDLNTGRVWICNNVQYSPNIGLYEVSPKNGKPRRIMLNEYPLKLMRELKKEQAMSVFNKGVANTIYCFEGAQGKSISPMTISNHFNNLGKKFGISNFHPHKLRHTMATFSLTHGADVTSVSEKLGHSMVSTTMNVYSHATKESQERVNEILSNVLYPNRNDLVLSEQ